LRPTADITLFADGTGLSAVGQKEKLKRAARQEPYFYTYSIV
jgi:hypothetical protein